MTGFALKSEYIPLLGILWPGTRTLLSPLLPTGDQQEQDSIRTVLGPVGLLDSSGFMIPPCKDAMSILADSSREITADFIRPDNFHTVTKYFPQGPGQAFTHVMDQTGKGQGYLELSPQEIIAICDIGDLGSNAAADTADLALDTAEARVLAAMLDGERISVRVAIAGKVNPGDLSITPAVQTRSAVERSLANAADRPGDLLFLGLLCNGDNFWQGQDTPPVEEDFSDLINRGLIRQSGNGYELSEPLLFIARRALFTDMAVMAGIRYTADGGIVRSEQMQGIRCDGMVFFFISPAGGSDRVLLKYLPSDKFEGIIQCLFGDPAWSLSRIEVPAAKTKPKAKFCPQCGARITEGKIFCKNCGTRAG